MYSIGGYIGLEVAGNAPFSNGGQALDLGRHGLEVIIKARHYRRLFVPRYTCAVLGGAIRNAGATMELYDLDDRLEPLLPRDHFNADDGVLLTNYFGLKQASMDQYARALPNLIVDNAQAFYAPVPHGRDHFNSCRKFFGVADGAYMHCDAAVDLAWPPAPSNGRYSHLLVAADQGIETGYPLSQAHERQLKEAPVRGMSRLTSLLMARVDHARVMTVRKANRDRLHAALQSYNRFPIDPAVAVVPMVYPFLSEMEGLQDRLLAARIYTARYWPETLGPDNGLDAGFRFLPQTIFLPVDQRYGPEHMDRIIEVVLQGGRG